MLAAMLVRVLRRPPGRPAVGRPPARRRRVAATAALVTVAAVLLGSCTGAGNDQAAGPPPPEPAELAAFYDQQLNWGPCTDYAVSSDSASAYADTSLDSTRVRVPQD